MTYLWAYLAVGAVVAALQMTVAMLLRRFIVDDERWRKWDADASSPAVMLVALTGMALLWPVLIVGWLYTVTNLFRVLFARRQ